MPETGSALEQFEWAVELDTTWLYEEYLATDLKVLFFCGYVPYVWTKKIRDASAA